MTKFNDVAQFDQSAVAGALVDFVPARVYVAQVGKATDKRVAIANTASREASQFLISQGGKVGKAAMGNIVQDGIVGIAKAARNGNYKPLAEALACMTAETVIIGTRASFESLGDKYEARLYDAQTGKNDGMTTSGKEGPKLRIAKQCIQLLTLVNEAIAAINAHVDAE